MTNGVDELEAFITALRLSFHTSSSAAGSLESTRGRPKDPGTQQLHSDDIVEGQKNWGRIAAEAVNHHALNAISELSKQMETMSQEMKDLKDEVRELRSAARSGGGRAHSKSPQRESPVPKVPRTMTVINQYFIEKTGELGSRIPLPHSPSPPIPEPAPAEPVTAPGPKLGTSEYGGWGRTQPAWDSSDSVEDRWWHQEYMEHVMPRPGPGCLPQRAATEIHGTFHQLYKVTVTPPSFPTTYAEPAGDPRSSLFRLSFISTGPSASLTGLAQHRPPSESEVGDLIPHPYVQFCRRDMVWVYHQVKSSMHLPQLIPNSGTLPSEAARRASPTCIKVDETGMRFSSNKAKTHHFHHYPKSVKGSSLSPPFVRRKIDLESAAADKRRRASKASSSSRHRAEATSAPISDSTEILLDLWVCCQCQTHVISSGPEAVIPSILDSVLLQRYIRDRENEPTTRPSKEEMVIYSLETIIRIMENVLFKLDNRMVKVGANLIKKIGWTPASQEFLAFLGFQHTPVPASEHESHPEGRLQPPKLAEGAPDTDMKRARLLQAWLELSIITQHYRKKHDRTLQGYNSHHKMWVSIENTYDETRRQIGAHETQIKQMPLTQSALIHENARIFWDSLGTTPETHSAEVVKFAYRRQTHCDPQNTALYFYFLKGVSDWAMRARHSSAEDLQILVSQEESRGRWSTDDLSRAAIILGFLSEEDLITVNDVQLPPSFHENLRDAWLTRVKEVNTDLSEHRINRQIADDRKTDLKESFRILAEYSGSPELVQAFRDTMRRYGNGMVDVQDALRTLNVPKESDDDMVITIFNMRVEDQPNLRERMLSALLVIGEDRNSSRLKNLALTGTDGNPQYQFGAFQTAYDNTTNVPPSTSYASSSSSPSVTTRLTANAREFVPVEMAGPTPVTPSPGFPLPKRSSAIKISNPNTGQAVVLGPPVPATVPRAVRIDQPTERPLTKKEIKRKAKLEAKENRRVETEAMERLMKEYEKNKAREKAEEVERIKMAEEEQRKREAETWGEAEEELRILVEERRKAEEELMEAEEERRKAKEELMKLEEEYRIRRDPEEQARKEREEAKAKAEEEQRLRRLAEEARFATKKQKKGTSDWRETFDRDWREKFDRAVYSERIQRPPAELDSSKHNEECFRASRKELEQTSTSQAASSSLLQEIPPPPPSIPRVNLPKGQKLTSDNPAEEGQKDSGTTVADVASHHALNAILKLSKQMEMILQEMKELKHEVRELRSAAESGDRKERSKSPQRESSVPKVPKTATAINQYFVMKKGELDFCPGDVITILDAPQDTPRGWMYGETNVTKRGFFPASYVELEQ